MIWSRCLRVLSRDNASLENIGSLKLEQPEGSQRPDPAFEPLPRSQYGAFPLTGHLVRGYSKAWEFAEAAELVKPTSDSQRGGEGLWGL